MVILSLAFSPKKKYIFLHGICGIGAQCISDFMIHSWIRWLFSQDAIWQTDDDSACKCDTIAKWYLLVVVGAS